jgi:polyisoprenoid-binding protein YceI
MTMKTTITPGTHVIDATHSNVEFAVKHLMISTVKGRFGDVTGTVSIPASGEPTIDVTINAASIDTRVEARDNHLRSADFFDVEKYPTLRFVSTKTQRTDDGYTVTGNLTIKDVTRPVTLTVTEEGAGIDPWGNAKTAFSATGKINRSDWGLNWNAALETGGVLVSEEVKLSFDVQLIAQAASRAA